MPKRDSSEFYEQLSAVVRCLRALAADAYAAFEVGTVQAKFLRHIGANGRLSQAELSRATGTAPSLTGRALETLLERGWVRRKRSELDKRAYLVELTASGERTRAKVEEARAKIVEQLARVLDEKDARDFDRIAHKLLAAFAAEPAADE